MFVFTRPLAPRGDRPELDAFIQSDDAHPIGVDDGRRLRSLISKTDQRTISEIQKYIVLTGVVGTGNRYTVASKQRARVRDSNYVFRELANGTAPRACFPLAPHFTPSKSAEL
ncbi:hypothetical protein EVAR_7685_1 [Eumeta japonica]|uniref:Uncharacterized protein n=1 Tax=Eumeta variegata TaxID=151549 RepID=A0A4C1TJG6_EUMVA|nr:hypothetical protein EVAR_7685_1 [Eumeta japonica]